MENDYREQKHDKTDSTVPLTKVIIRRLPPSLTEESFLEHIKPLPSTEHFYFVKAEKRLKQNAFSRAYIKFVKQDDIWQFKERFDNHPFIDNRGAEYRAVVEFAPFQGVPVNDWKQNNGCKVGKLENDRKYLDFLEYQDSEDEDVTVNRPFQEYFPQENNNNKSKTTPLLEYIKDKRQTEETRQKYSQRNRTRDSNCHDSKKEQIRLSDPISKSKMSTKSTSKNDHAQAYKDVGYEKRSVSTCGSKICHDRHKVCRRKNGKLFDPNKEEPRKTKSVNIEETDFEAELSKLMEQFELKERNLEEFGLGKFDNTSNKRGKKEKSVKFVPISLNQKFLITQKEQSPNEVLRKTVRHSISLADYFAPRTNVCSLLGKEKKKTEKGEVQTPIKAVKITSLHNSLVKSKDFDIKLLVQPSSHSDGQND
uniref:UPF3 domain-containing protein n=1 Tax=Timema monikensis TaxID=170555 RepID=A0A7R9HU42_9NEOP|nr:unnamed protein product [Timema monikensis]